MAAVGLVPFRHAYTVRHKTLDRLAYVQLTPAFFDSLAQHLPEPCNRYIFHDPACQEHEDPEDGTAYNESYCQWLLGCWDAVLQPNCT